MNYQTFKKLRVLFYIQGCPRCKLLLPIVNSYNFKVNVYNQIKLVDCTYYQNYGIPTDPLILLYGKHFDGYPSLFYGDKKIIGANSRIESEAQILTLFEKELIIFEENEHKFNKVCEFKNEGLFKNKAICNVQ